MDNATETMGAPATIPGRDLRPGDDLIFLGTAHRITRITPYSHPVATGGEEWRIATSITFAHFGRGPAAALASAQAAHRLLQED